MTLEQRYNTAPATTYAGKVRTLQAADYGAKKGVDFMDAGTRSGTQDTFQSNFQRNASDTKIFTQGKSETSNYAPSERKGLSRWYGRALNYAFTNPEAAGNSLQFSLHTTYKNFRGGTRDIWSGFSTFHRWTPQTKFVTSLSTFSSSRAQSKTLATRSGTRWFEVL